MGETSETNNKEIWVRVTSSLSESGDDFGESNCNCERDG